MFELSVARKYLMPRWRQISVSVISLISIFVIALVVWLITVFFSVTTGLEKRWIDKLVAITAPLRLTPTDAYYNSYYYQIDNISAAAQYSPKSIAEKMRAPVTDPYDPSIDEEPPASLPPADRDAQGALKDPVKGVYAAIAALQATGSYPGLTAQDFEMTFSSIRLRMLRNTPKSSQANATAKLQENQGFLSHAIYLTSLDENSPSLEKTLITPRMADISNLFHLLAISSTNIQEDSPEGTPLLEKSIFQKRLENFLANSSIAQLQTPDGGWVLPKSFYANLDEAFSPIVISIATDPLENALGSPRTLFVPRKESEANAWKTAIEAAGHKASLARLHIPPHLQTIQKMELETSSGQSLSLPMSTRLILQEHLLLPAKAVEGTALRTYQAKDVLFNLEFEIQGRQLKGVTPFGTLTFGEAALKTDFPAPEAAQTSQSHPLWIHHDHLPSRHLVIPDDADNGKGVVLPKSFQDAGVLLGDQGYLSYFTPTASSLQEQRIPIFVAGFYDPGIIPLGGKLVLVDREVTSLIRSAYNQDSHSLGNGINVHFNHIEQAEKLKAALQSALDAQGLGQYWKVETFREYDFAKELIQQLQSEKHVFTLISLVIIIVACSNIISMLVILVNDKKKEIGILLSMGATSRSIAAIFGLCGLIIGFMGSALGIAGAMITLHNLEALISLISQLQGYSAFNAHYYGGNLPNELNPQVLLLVIGSTSAISLLAGLVPAIKASLLRPSSILRSE